jgi:cytochrome c biogenesis factor
MIPFGFLWFLTMLVALILLPILIKILFKADIAIDEHFFHQYINPLLLIGLIFCGFSPFMKLNKSHFWCLLSTVLLTSMWCFMAQPYFSGFATFAAFVGFWILCSVINSINKIFIKGFVAAHLGVGLCILGASHSEIFTTSQEYDLAHLPKIFASYPISYKSMHKNETPQMTEEIVQLQVNSTLLMPSLQHFHTNLTTKHKSTWVGIYLDHIHATCFTQNNTWRVELMHKPWINIFWLGVVFILLGISVSAGNAIFKQRYQQIL